MISFETSSLQRNFFCYALARKADVLQNIEAVSNIAKKLGYAIKVLRTDNDTVYNLKAAQKLYEQLGTTHKSPFPTTSTERCCRKSR